jgi:Na+/H+ antiporter NhaD/arsenite permease-like protein
LHACGGFDASFEPVYRLKTQTLEYTLVTTLIVIVFVLGYLAIASEHQIHVNKAASALFIGVVCWTLYMLDVDRITPSSSVPTWFADKLGGHGSATEHLSREYLVEGQLLHIVAEIAQILFFLMGAMTIVELVDAHEGFALITQRIRTKNQVALLWLVAWITFFASAVLDNLTTTIVMVSLLRKLVHETQLRRFYAGIVVIAANAGGAWSVIGDVTTTMLWVKDKIGTVETILNLFLASVACLLVPLLVMSRGMSGNLPEIQSFQESKHTKNLEPWHQVLFLSLGIGGLLSVPIFKFLTHLPPFMGMMLALSVLWMISEFVKHTLDEKTRTSTGVLAVLQRIDMSSILFFLGILLAVGALSATGLLGSLATWLSNTIPSNSLIAILIGLLSAVVDNVPLVAAGIEMYRMPENDSFWMMLAFCAGTGGSCLIIGSAAGVAAMGLEHINFIWYLRRIAPWALLGYIAGILVYLAQAKLTGQM